MWKVFPTVERFIGRNCRELEHTNLTAYVLADASLVAMVSKLPKSVFTVYSLLALRCVVLQKIKPIKKMTTGIIVVPAPVNKIITQLFESGYRYNGLHLIGFCIHGRFSGYLYYDS